jgi:hypothetical protein
MADMTAQCHACGATITLPLPDAWQDVQGTRLDKEHMSQEDNEARLTAFLEDLVCPSCQQGPLRVVAPSEGRRQGTFPVYLPYVMHLERYVEVEADSMEDAIALVHQMVREGHVPRPRSTEGLADWTEITDLLVAKNGFIINGEVI